MERELVFVQLTEGGGRGTHDMVYVGVDMDVVIAVVVVVL